MIGNQACSVWIIIQIGHVVKLFLCSQVIAILLVLESGIESVLNSKSSEF